MLSLILKVLYFISMSDILSPVANLKFQDCINLTTDHSPKFVNKLSVDTTAVALTLQISSNFVLCIENCRYNSGFTCVKICNTQFSFLQLLECDRLEARFQSLCSKVSNLYKTQYKGGRKRQVFNKTTHKIAIFKEELLDVQCLSFKVVNFDQEKFNLESKCKNLFEILKKRENTK